MADVGHFTYNEEYNIISADDNNYYEVKNDIGEVDYVPYYWFVDSDGFYFQNDIVKNTINNN